MSAPFQPVEDAVEVETTPSHRPTVDLVQCNFSGTLQNPCFWILVGVLGCLGAQYLLKDRNG